MNQKENRGRKRLDGRNWKGVPISQRKRLQKQGLRCPRCGCPRLEPLDPGKPQLRCGYCRAILRMTGKLELKVVGRVVQGAPNYWNDTDRQRQDQGPPRPSRHP